MISVAQKIHVKETETHQRVETGPVEFVYTYKGLDGETRTEHDWPGLFIRGDNAADLALKLKHVLDYLHDNPPATPELVLDLFALKGYYKTIINDVIQ